MEEPGFALEEENLPRCDSAGTTMLPDFFLSHAIWRNSLGSYQPETGVRSVVAGEVQKDFRLIQHGVGNFAFAEPLIIRGLRKGWDGCRIADFVSRLSQRCRIKATSSSEAKPKAAPRRPHDRHTRQRGR